MHPQVAPQIWPPLQNLSWSFHNFLGMHRDWGSSSVWWSWDETPGILGYRVCTLITSLHCPSYVPISQLKRFNTFLEITIVLSSEAIYRKQIVQFWILFWTQKNIEHSIHEKKTNTQKKQLSSRVQTVDPWRETFAAHIYVLILLVILLNHYLWPPLGDRECPCLEDLYWKTLFSECKS